MGLIWGGGRASVSILTLNLGGRGKPDGSSQGLVQVPGADLGRAWGLPAAVPWLSGPSAENACCHTHS